MTLNEAVTMRPDFKQKLTSFFKGCKRIHAEYCATHGFENDSKWDMTWLKRYVRIVVSIDASTRAFVFIDIETGEVLKTGGWKKPAITKTKRGNIFDERNGLRHISPYGVSSVNKIKHGPF